MNSKLRIPLCWKELRAVIAEARERRKEWSAWLDRAMKSLDELFKSDTTDGTIEAARIYKAAIVSGAPPSERAVATTVQGFAAALRG